MLINTEFKCQNPILPKKDPMLLKSKRVKKYFWCACGLSQKQPFCDGSHKSTGFSCIPYTAEATKKVYFCGCKHSNKKPLCDGTHNKLED